MKRLVIFIYIFILFIVTSCGRVISLPQSNLKTRNLAVYDSKNSVYYFVDQNWDINIWDVSNDLMETIIKGYKASFLTLEEGYLFFLSYNDMAYYKASLPYVDVTKVIDLSSNWVLQVNSRVFYANGGLKYYDIKKEESGQIEIPKEFADSLNINIPSYSDGNLIYQEPGFIKVVSLRGITNTIPKVSQNAMIAGDMVFYEKDESDETNIFMAKLDDEHLINETLLVEDAGLIAVNREHLLYTKREKGNLDLYQISLKENKTKELVCKNIPIRSFEEWIHPAPQQQLVENFLFFRSRLNGQVEQVAINLKTREINYLNK